MDPVLAGGLIGIAGTLVGVLAQTALSAWRERREGKRRLLRALTAVSSELLSTVSILNKTLERQAWWPEGDEPLSDEWKRNRDVLTDALSYEVVSRINMVYESVRSLAATRSSPLTPRGKPRSRFNRMLRDDPAGKSFFALIWTDDRWPSAAAEVEQARYDVGAVLSECIGPVHRPLLEWSDKRWWQRRRPRALGDEQDPREPQIDAGTVEG
jgi:hypothetical protein